MINADKFEQVFGIYATELWAKPEKEFLEWLNSEAQEVKDISISSAERIGKWERCGDHHLCSECDEWALTKWDEDECDEVDVLTDFCPHCGARMKKCVE